MSSDSGGSSASQSSASGSSSSSSEAWTGNEGESSEHDEEVPANESLRGSAVLVTGSCPRKYPRELDVRKQKGPMLPEDYTKEEFFKKFRNPVFFVTCCEFRHPGQDHTG